MPRITPGNHLYFYQLFSAEMGLGKQTPLQRVEEVLAEADVLLDDIECDSIDQLLQELADFLKVTTFKKGRVFVTVQQREDLDALLEKAEQPPAEKEAVQAGKSWKRARRSKDVKPTKPRHKRVVKKQQPEPEAVAEAPVEIESNAVDAVSPVEPDGVAEVVVAESEVATEEQEVVVEAAATGPAAVDESAAVEPETTIETSAEFAGPEQGRTSQDVEPAQEHALAPEPSISFNITFVPDQTEAAPDEVDQTEAEDEAEEVDTPDQAEPTAVEEPPVPTQEPTPIPTPATAKELRREPQHTIGLPSSISQDVFCPDACLRKIYEGVPHKVGLLEMLDESWSFAQEAGTLEGSRTRVTFPLSRVIEGNTPIEVTIARVPRLTSGKKWQLVEVDAG